MAAQIGNLQLVAGDQIGHKGFADACAGMQSVEGMCHSAATSAGHVCFEAQDFKAQPVGFAAGANVCAQRRQGAGFGATDECWGLKSAGGAKQPCQEQPYLPCQAQNRAEYQGKCANY